MTTQDLNRLDATSQAAQELMNKLVELSATDNAALNVLSGSWIDQVAKISRDLSSISRQSQS